jgi:lipoyl-dependent peroxiredoxin subunit D
MGLDTVKAALPAYARHLRLNLGALTNGSPLGEQQLWGAVVTAALTSPPSAATAELVADAQSHLSEAALDAAKSAAAMMAMNNVYYRAKHLLSDAGVTGYDEIPARLRMQVIGTRGGVKKADYELWCLVASAINGCGACLVAHEQALRAAGLGPPQIHEGLRIAAVVHAACATLAAEDALAPT